MPVTKFSTPEKYLYLNGFGSGHDSEFDDLVNACKESPLFQEKIAALELPKDFEVVVEPWPYGAPEVADGDTPTTNLDKLDLPRKAIRTRRVIIQGTHRLPSIRQKGFATN
ncbi:Copper amine oxidase 1 like protein [Verticillium longisporum]|nr:Copper amine oxidase 1 like protein [Verticillium longisporum]